LGLPRPTEVSQRPRSADKPNNRDVYQPSAAAKDFNTARRATMTAPDIRAAKVADLQERIANGNYNPSALDIATKIVDALV